MEKKMKEFIDIVNEHEANPWIQEIEKEREEATGLSKNTLATIDFSFVKADEENENLRVYPEDVVKKSIGEFEEHIEKSPVAGCLDHPIGANSELAKVSHVLTNVRYDEQTKKGRATAAILNTQKGKDLLTLINSGMKIGASMRGIGETDQLGNVKPGYQLHSIDIVCNPSFGSAAQISNANLVYESGNAILEGMPQLTVEDTITVRYSRALELGYQGDLQQYKEEVLGLSMNDKIAVRYSKALEAGYKKSLSEFKEEILKTKK
jgi:hypothetical protein